MREIKLAMLNAIVQGNIKEAKQKKVELGAYYIDIATISDNEAKRAWIETPERVICSDWSKPATEVLHFILDNYFNNK